MWKGAIRLLLEASYVGMSSRGILGTATPHLWELRSGSKLTEVCFVRREGGNGGTVRGTRAAGGDAWTGPWGSGPPSAPRQPGPQTANTFLPLWRLDGDQVQAGRSGSGQSPPACGQRPSRPVFMCGAEGSGPSVPGRALISSWALPPQPPQACLQMPSPGGQGCNLQWGSLTFIPTVHTGKGSLPWKVSPHM